MELTWLEDFLALAKLRNFTRASQARHATQAALSKRIKALEAWYGLPLVDRSTYPIRLTAAGQRFAETSEHLVTTLYRSRRDARSAAAAEGHTIRFAMPHTLAINFFPHWWHEQSDQLGLSAKVIAADFSECVELLASGACQFLLYYHHTGTADGLDALETRRARIGADWLVPVCQPDDQGRPLFGFEPGIGNQPVPMLTYPPESFLGQVTAEIQTQLATQCPLRSKYETSLVEALKAEALLGEGIAWLPKSIIQQELASGTLRIVEGVSLAVPLDIWLCCAEAGLAPRALQHLFSAVGP